MNKTPSNKYDVAIKQLAKFNVEVPKEINENEKNMYHVLNIESSANMKTREIIDKYRIQKFHKDSFEKSLKNNDFLRLGYENIVIFHDPTMNNVEPAKTVEPAVNKLEPAKDVIDKIALCETLEELDLIIDSRKTVLEAIAEKRKELTK